MLEQLWGLINKTYKTMENSTEKQKATSMRVVDGNGNSHFEKMFHYKSLEFGRSNARLMQNSRGFFLAIDSNGQIVGGSEYAIKISDTQAEKMQKLEGDSQFEYIQFLAEI